jgi:hypothetical protein
MGSPWAGGIKALWRKQLYMGWQNFATSLEPIPGGIPYLASSLD